MRFVRVTYIPRNEHGHHELQLKRPRSFLSWLLRRRTEVVLTYVSPVRSRRWYAKDTYHECSPRVSARCEAIWRRF